MVRSGVRLHPHESTKPIKDRVYHISQRNYSKWPLFWQKSLANKTFQLFHHKLLLFFPFFASDYWRFKRFYPEKSLQIQYFKQSGIFVKRGKRDPNLKFQWDRNRSCNFPLLCHLLNCGFLTIQKLLCTSWKVDKALGWLLFILFILFYGHLKLRAVIWTICLD